MKVPGSNKRRRNSWNVKVSPEAARTVNPIRQFGETVSLVPNPAKPSIPLSIGKVENH